MVAREFLVRGAVEFGEPGVFMMAGESPAELTANVRLPGFDLNRFVKQQKTALDHRPHRAQRDRGRGRG